MLTKKTISPVVATALLLVVAVVSVVGFQTFFNTYSTGLFSKVETQSSDSVGNTQIENLIGNSLYFKNSNTENITLNSVKINGVDCNYVGNLTQGITEINVSSCISNLVTYTPEVVVYTNSGVYSKKFYVKEIITSISESSSSSFNCSELNLSGGTWTSVPGNLALGTSDFCVMKYEAKNLTNIATSQAGLTPWININQINARANCSALGTNYHLITNAEWTTIARNVESVSSNWNSTVVGNGFMFSGHNDDGPSNMIVASTNDSDGYYGTNDDVSSPGDGIFFNFASNDARAYMGQKRTLTLNNSEVIWDLSGNAYEWNNDTCSSGDPWMGSGGGWLEWTNININGIEKTIGGPIGNYDASNSIGRYFGCDDGDGFMSSAGYNYGEYAGVFFMRLDYAPTTTDTYLGFRCAYTP